jgi:CMP-N-acetylneuraminic acid synthetase
MLLQPTCPFRYVSDLHLSYKKYIETACNTLISVENISNYNTPTQYTGTLELLNPEIESGAGTLRQNFNNLWWRNGSIYIFNSDNFVKKNKLIRTPISGYEMPWWRSINIDTHQDFEKATDCLKLPKIIELKRHLFS